METCQEFCKNNMEYITKEQILKVLKTLDVKVKSNLKKDELIRIMTTNTTYENIYSLLKDESFGIGVKAIMEKTGLSKYKVEKLINNETFHVIYTRRSNNYGKYVHVRYIKYEDVYNWVNQN